MSNVYERHLIYIKIRKKHRQHLKQIFIKLKKIELQINIIKCEFFKTKIIFLKIILFVNDLKMYFNKIQNIIDWTQFICLKNVQIFVNFCNFYRRFIKKNFKIIKIFIRINYENQRNFRNIKKTCYRNFRFSLLRLQTLNYFKRWFVELIFEKNLIVIRR